MNDEPKLTHGWTRLFHSSGAQVTLPVPVGNGEKDYYVVAFAAVSAAIEAGWLVTMPGLEIGEEKVEAFSVVRRNKRNQDQTVTPIIDLYERDDKFKSFSLYLNRSEDVADFEAASGFKLASLRAFPGTAAPQRGAGPDSDEFFANARKPFGLVVKPNPKWDAAQSQACKAKNEVYKTPKRVFVRWADQPVKAEPQADAPKAAEPTPVLNCREFLKSNPDLAAFNRYINTAYDPLPLGEVRDKVWWTLDEHAGINGWRFNQTTFAFERKA